MWVLEARDKAETVWYPVVWDKIKDASNVIDYDIREEQTIDQSSVFNANNDTTTGMANVIPWINAPKLIASTSIIWDLWWWTLIATASVTLEHQFLAAWSYSETVTQFTISWEWWTEKIVQTDQWLKIPSDWLYMFNMEYWWIVQSINCTDSILVNWTTIHSFVWSYTKYWATNPTETLFFNLNKWDIISTHSDISWNYNSMYLFTHLISMWITKIK